MNEAEIADYHGGVKSVEWDHIATPDSKELTVTKGDEVIIITPPKESDETEWYKVKHMDTGKIGNIPKRCFYQRMKVNFSFTDQGLSVDEGDIVGIINEDTKDDMLLVMKKNGTSGKIPVGCFSASYKAYESHIAANSEELSVNKGDNIGIIDKGYWKGYFRGKTGLVPSKCFEPPKEAEIAARHNFPGGLKFVRWDHAAKQGSNELKVKKGDEVIIITRPKEDDETGWYEVKHTATGDIGNIPKSCFYTRMKVNFCSTGQETGELSVDKDEIVGIINEDTEDDMWLVMKKNGTIGKIPVRCFYASYKAYGNHTATGRRELSINKGDNIGIIDKNRDDGYWMGYFRGRTGLVPGKCFEPPIKATKSGEVDNRALNYSLTSQDSEDVIDYIKDLEVGQIINLGVSLGLSDKTVTSAKSKDIPSRMVTAWLSRKDNVMETSGNPSWKSLKDALLKIEVIDVANMIMKDNTRFDMSMMVNLQWYNDDNVMDEISILNEACNKWATIAKLLGTNKAVVEEEYRTINDRFQKVLETWIETGGNNDYPATWMGLKKMLNACELDMCTQKITDAMKILDIYEL